MLEENTLSAKTRYCPHAPKVIRYSIDIGLGDTIFLELCTACRILSNLKHVVKMEVIEQ